MNAIGCFIFGGSQTIGHIQEGWHVDRVLEMTDDMVDNNAYHFIRNYHSIDVIPRSEWDEERYIKYLKNEDFDLLFSNPPCSGLSSINRNANVNNDVNKYIYEVTNIINDIEPKTFLIENAPTLVTKGLKIVKDIQKTLTSKYRITVITDLAGNHNVPMHRRRTLVVGWRRDIFDKIPIISQQLNNNFTINDAFMGLTDDIPNMSQISLNDRYDFTRFYNLVKPNDTVVKTLCYNLENVRDKLSEDELNLVLRTKEKYDKGGSVWDKSPLRLDADGKAPSITSVNRYIHPTENRDIYIRECARLMGYPDDFIFFEGAGVSDIQCIAQGVPVNFIRYISNQIKNQLENSLYYREDCDIMYINQSSGVQKITTFRNDEFQRCEKIDRNDRKLEEVELW